VATGEEGDVGTVEDRLAIERQIYELGNKIDNPDPEGWAAIFTDDGVADATMLGMSEPFGYTKGSDELREFARHTAERDMQELHHMTGVVFEELSADRARTRSTILVTARWAKTPEPLVLTHGFYRDLWRKTPEGWRLAHRQFTKYGSRS